MVRCGGKWFLRLNLHVGTASNEYNFRTNYSRDCTLFGMLLGCWDQCVLQVCVNDSSSMWIYRIIYCALYYRRINERLCWAMCIQDLTSPLRLKGASIFLLRLESMLAFGEAVVLLILSCMQGLEFRYICTHSSTSSIPSWDQFQEPTTQRIAEQTIACVWVCFGVLKTPRCVHISVVLFAFLTYHILQCMTKYIPRLMTMVHTCCSECASFATLWQVFHPPQLVRLLHHCVTISQWLTKIKEV